MYEPSVNRTLEFMTHQVSAGFNRCCRVMGEHGQGFGVVGLVYKRCLGQYHPGTAPFSGLLLIIFQLRVSLGYHTLP